MKSQKKLVQSGAETSHVHTTLVKEEEEEKGEIFMCPCTISCNELDTEHFSLLCWWWLTSLSGVYFTLSRILSPGAVSEVAARRQDKEPPGKLPSACVHFLYGRKGRAAGWAQTIQLVSPHTFILSRPHMLNSQCVGTKEGAMAWSNTAVWYCGETSCNSLCQSARGSCFQAEEALIHNEQRKLFKENYKNNPQTKKGYFYNFIYYL